MNHDHYPPIQWDFILSKIEEGQCLLVLGPEVMRDGEHSLQSLLIQYLQIEQNPMIQGYYPQEDLFLFDRPSNRTLTCHKIKSFYSRYQPNMLLQQLAQIPFSIFTTVTPDVLLPTTFEQLGFPHQFGFYRKNKEPQDIKTPTAQLPLIYNLFGCISSEESLILTHNDLYDYFKSIFTRRSMPEKLKLQLLDVKSIILLGIPYERWYFQLLLRELEIHNQQYDFTRYAINQSMNDDLKTFCHQQFQINFISRNISDFISELYARCQQRGILRKASASKLSPLAKAKQQVAKGALEQAIEILEEALSESALENNIMMISGRYRNWKRRKNSGVLREEEATVQENQISEDLLELIDEANKLD